MVTLETELVIIQTKRALPTAEKYSKKHGIPRCNTPLQYPVAKNKVILRMMASRQAIWRNCRSAVGWSRDRDRFEHWLGKHSIQTPLLICMTIVFSVGNLTWCRLLTVQKLSTDIESFAEHNISVVQHCFSETVLVMTRVGISECRNVYRILTCSLAR